MGRSFFKMSGSGNDFVVVDARGEPPGSLDDPRVIAAVCARGTGVGADGIVFLEPSRGNGSAFAMRYINRDGSRAAACGNASLCIARLAVELGVAPAGGMRFESDAGVLEASVRGNRPTVSMPPVTRLQQDVALPRQGGELRIGFADAGVPHVVVAMEDVEAAEVVRRGRELRGDPIFGPGGSNVNFVSAERDGSGAWRIRTYERGVEGETLACGTGAIASAALLEAWGLAASPVTLRTRSGRSLGVDLTTEHGTPGRRLATLTGEARIVFRGEFDELETD
jgi:diaminopimelate epimerase